MLVLKMHACSVVSNFLRPNYSPWGSSVHGFFPGKNTRMNCLALLQGSSWPRDQMWISCTGRQPLPLSHLERYYTFERAYIICSYILCHILYIYYIYLTLKVHFSSFPRLSLSWADYFSGLLTLSLLPSVLTLRM